MRYALREALAAFRRAPITVLAAVMVGLALFVIGLFTLAAYNMEEALREVEPDGVTISLGGIDY